MECGAPATPLRSQPYSPAPSSSPPNSTRSIGPTQTPRHTPALHLPRTCYASRRPGYITREEQMRRFFSILAIVVCLVAPLLSTSNSKTQSSHYLFAWAGDRAQRGKDFLAVIDADPSSPAFGHLLTTLVTDQTTLRVHHTEYSMPESNMLFANDHDAGRTFIFNLNDP